MPAKILVEYAKSGRAACKGCGNTIAKGCMRLGIVSKAAGGFDMTRWYHLQCLPSQSEVVSAENINGFQLLKAPDQEALKALVAEFGKQSGSPVTGNEDSQQKPVKSITEEMCGDDQGSRKKLKVEHASIKSCGHDDVGFLDMLSPSELRSRYKDAILPPKWKAFQTVIFLEQEDGLKASEKVAAFDFDGCLVKTSVRKVGADAWSLLYSTIPEKLQSYYNKGYKLVIFTNESNIDRWKNSRQKAVDSKLGRLEGFINRVKVPMQVFVACGIEGTGDAFRKPKSGMWRLMERHFNSGIIIDMEQSFYVGDAAGRIDDHSDADIGFAKVAVGIILSVKFGGNKQLSKGFSALVVTVICLFVAGFGWSWGSLGWTVPSEIFPLETRSARQAITVSVNFLFTFAIAQAFLSLLCTFKYGIFLFFAGWICIMTVFVYLFLPETKGVPIEEMIFQWRKHWFWKNIVPPVVEGAQTLKEPDL